MISQADVIEWLYSQVVAKGTGDQDMGQMEKAIGAATGEAQRQVLQRLTQQAAETRLHPRTLTGCVACVAGVALRSKVSGHPTGVVRDGLQRQFLPTLRRFLRTLMTAAANPAAAGETASRPALQRALELYERGLYLQAYAVVEPFGPFPSWSGTEARVFAGRLAGNLGNHKLAYTLALRTWRRDRQHPKARVYALPCITERFGLLRAREFCDAWGELADGEPDDRHYFFSQRAHQAIVLREFAAAEDWLRRAEAVLPGSPWLCMERSEMLERQDRFADALAAVRAAYLVRPWYRPAVQQTVHLLQVLNREGEALEFMREALCHIESCAVAAQLAGLLNELQRWDELEPALATYERLAILREPDDSWLALNRADAVYHSGRFADAARFLRTIKDSDYHTGFAARLEAADAATVHQRVELPVPFVRQHWMTCAPATLAALTTYWGRPVDHLELAEEICYSGTPGWRERDWLDRNGWVTREFRLTWDVACALLDRGVPFAVATVHTTSGHRQAVIGYDRLRQTFILREPNLYYAAEAIADTFLKSQAANGPECLLLLPTEKVGLLSGIELPDTGLYDHFHRFNLALSRHDRPAAVAALCQLETAAPGHLLVFEARRGLATYDGNNLSALAALEDLLRLHPEAGHLRLARLGWLRELSRREDRLAMLREISKDGKGEPVFWQILAQELAADARRLPEARYWCRRALRVAPQVPDAWRTLGTLDWDEGRREQALRAYHTAACLDDTREDLARTYFSGARFLRQTDRALAFLRQRVERLGDKAAGPFMTLFDALTIIDRDPEAATVLEEAIRRRPDDGNLLLFAAEMHLRRNRRDEASRLLAAARGKTRHLDWLLKAAILAAESGAPGPARAHWQEVLDLDPLHLDAIRNLVRLLAETEGLAAAHMFLAAQCERFPYHYGLHQLYVEWLRNEGPAVREPVLRRLAEIEPADGWTWRELAGDLEGHGRQDEAFAAARQALKVEPQVPASHFFLGQLLLHSGRAVEARAEFREALRLSADYTHALRGLLAASSTLAEKKAELAFAEGELIQQVLFGDSLLAYRREAHGILEPEELLASLQKALEARPDLWHAWSAVILQLTDMQRLDEALALAQKAVERFPALPSLCMDLAHVRQARLEPEAASLALKRALELNPDYSPAARRLAELLADRGATEEARAAYEAACRRDPLDAANHGGLARQLWQLDKKEDAVAAVRRALVQDPDYEWAWDALRDWGGRLGKPQLAAELARELTCRRAGEAMVWVRLAEALIETPDAPELHAALDRAVALRPRLLEAHDLRARVLMFAGRFQDAVAACRPAVFGTQPPAELRAREAWVEAQRGDLYQAINVMQKVVSDSPDFYWAWERIAEWTDRLEMRDETLAATRKLVQLAPLNPVPRGYLADLERQRGHVEEAKAELKRALALDPAYEYGALLLADILVEADKPNEACSVLADLRQHANASPHVLAAEGRIAALQKRDRAAGQILEQLCAAPDTPVGAMVVVSNAMVAQGDGMNAESVLWEYARKPGAHLHCGALWVDLRVRRQRWWLLDGLDRMLADHQPAGRRAVIQFLNSLAETWQAGSAQLDVLAVLRARFLCWRLLRKHDSWLRTDSEGWGAVGFLLSCRKADTATVAWLADYQTRPDVTPWMLHNLFCSLQRLGRDAEALQVCRYHLDKLGRRDHTTPIARLWLAFSAACGDTPLGDAEQERAGLREDHFDDFWKTVFQLLESVLAARRAAAAHAGDPAAFEAAWKEHAFGPLRKYLWNWTTRGQDRIKVQAFERACRRLIRETGSWRVRFWYWNKRHLGGSL